MRAMVLSQLTNLAENSAPLRLTELPDPVPGDGEILIKVSACGVCHTELDEIEGRLPPPHLPIVLGHQVVGRVVAVGHKDPMSFENSSGLQVGDRVGVAWIYSACGTCEFCRSGRENLCSQFKATGRDAHGGYAQYMTVRADFAYCIPDVFSDVEAAPLLCAGAIGYRSLALTNLQDGQTLGLTGFGASAHLVLKLAQQRFPNSPIVVFARSAAERAFALELGAVWAGDTTDRAPNKCAAIIDTTPIWTPVVEALNNLAPGGRLVINAIRKEAADQNALLRLDYPAHLWLEKEIKSVANVTRRDVSEFLQLAAEIPIQPEVETFELAEANRALMELKQRHVRGAKVLIVE
ncbi:MAG TPA: zinc-dependent alcohol dehydrogenase family protein [Anaerolineae bacterium]|nr:zinc-dependent alcohol dehydrogenase family protein [Anaerolineae bacterium]